MIHRRSPRPHLNAGSRALLRSMTLERGVGVSVLRDQDRGPGPWPDESTSVIDAPASTPTTKSLRTSDGPTPELLGRLRRSADGNGEEPHLTAQVLECNLDPL